MTMVWVGDAMTVLARAHCMTVVTFVTCTPADFGGRLATNAPPPDFCIVVEPFVYCASRIQTPHHELRQGDDGQAAARSLGRKRAYDYGSAAFPGHKAQAVHHRPGPRAHRSCVCGSTRLSGERCSTQRDKCAMAVATRRV